MVHRVETVHFLDGVGLFSLEPCATEELEEVPVRAYLRRTKEGKFVSLSVSLPGDSFDVERVSLLTRETRKALEEDLTLQEALKPK